MTQRDERDTPVYVAMAVADLPVAHVPSVERNCARCGSGVWVDRNTAGQVQAEGWEVVCRPCASGDLAATEERLLLPGTVASIEAWLRRQ